MKIFFIACLLLGSMVVFQPSLNRMILEHKGLGFAALLNGAIVFIAAFLLFLFICGWPERFPETMRFLPHKEFHWWFILPGVMGFLLVFMVPLMIKNLGAFPTVVAMMLGQVTTSLLWDTYAGGVPISTTRLAGLVLVMAGAYFSFRPSS